jgi:hypothetical protein
MILIPSVRELTSHTKSPTHFCARDRVHRKNSSISDLGLKRDFRCNPQSSRIIEGTSIRSAVCFKNGGEKFGKSMGAIRIEQPSRIGDDRGGAEA